MHTPDGVYSSTLPTIIWAPLSLPGGTCQLLLLHSVSSYSGSFLPAHTVTMHTHISETDIFDI